LQDGDEVVVDAEGVGYPPQLRARDLERVLT
jgi:hypothetical protein